MAFQAAPRLSEVRQAVAIRCNAGSLASRSPAMRDLMNEQIRAAFNDIINDVDFLVLRSELRAELVDKQHYYDLPDNMDPGDIVRITIEDVDNRRTTIKAGVRPYEKSDWTMPPPDPETGEQQDRSGLPLRYEIINQQIGIYPAPKVELFPYMIVEGYRRPPEPVNDDDRIEVDKEAIIRLAAAYVKMQLNHRDAGAAMSRYQVYVDGKRADNSEKETFRVGGGFSQKFPYVAPRNTEHPDYSRYPFWRPPCF